MISNALIISLTVLFIHFSFWDGEIFDFIKKIIPPKGKLYKPIYGCPICMCMWYGTAIYWSAFHVSIKDYLLTIGTACGMAVIYVVLLSVREACVNYNKQHD